MRRPSAISASVNAIWRMFIGWRTADLLKRTKSDCSAASQAVESSPARVSAYMWSASALK